MRITERPCWNKILFVLYKLMRLLNISYWFYFSPLFFTLFQFFIPLYVLWRDGQLPIGDIEEE